MAKTATMSAVTKAAEKTSKAMEKALAAEATEAAEPKPVKGKGKAKDSTKSEGSDGVKPVKRTRAPSDFNKYMKVRLAEMKQDEAFMAEFPNHRERFSKAANEWKEKTADMSKEEKTAFVAQLIEQHEAADIPPAAKPAAKPKAVTPPVQVPVESEEEEESDAEEESE
jgi:hypothetical protein